MHPCYVGVLYGLLNQHYTRHLFKGSKLNAVKNRLPSQRTSIGPMSLSGFYYMLNAEFNITCILMHYVVKTNFLTDTYSY